MKDRNLPDEIKLLILSKCTPEFLLELRCNVKELRDEIDYLFLKGDYLHLA